MSLGQRVREARLARGMGQAKLAAGVGTLQQTIHYLEERDSNRSRFAKDIARVLGVSLRWLATGEGEMHGKDALGYELEAERLMSEPESVTPAGLAAQMSDVLGLPLRDRFAIAAMPAVMELAGAQGLGFNRLAESAYEWADAMMEARGKGGCSER